MQCRILSAQTNGIIAYFGEKCKSFFEKTYFFRVEPKEEAVKPHIATDLRNGLRLAPVNDDFVCSISYPRGNVNTEKNWSYNKCWGSPKKDVQKG